MKEPIHTLAVLGGDRRQYYLAQALEREGFEVFSGGLERLKGEEDNALSVVEKGDAVILPLPFSTDGTTVNAPYAAKPIPLSALLDALKKGTFVLGGRLDAEFVSKAEGKGLIPQDYYASEALAIRNALPTAEGAIAIAMETLPVTLFGAKAAVIGYGRIGKLLSSRLHALGAEVTVAARKAADRAMAEICGLQACSVSELAGFIGPMRVVFNTVPAQVIGREVLAAARQDCLWIDLASRPGGIDRSAAQELGRQVISALSLPGRYAPQSAGEYLAKEIVRILKGGGDT